MKKRQDERGGKERGIKKKNIGNKVTIKQLKNTLSFFLSSFHLPRDYLSFVTDSLHLKPHSRSRGISGLGWAARTHSEARLMRDFMKMF